MRFLLTFTFLLTSVAFAQDPVRPGLIPPDLQRYLQLTDTQVNGIVRRNAEFRTYQSGKSLRQRMVLRELAVEMNRDPLDPTAIGLRHVELESIRREIEAEQKKTVEAVQGLLTPAQRARLDALAQVFRLHNTACAAILVNLLPTAVQATSPGLFNPLLGSENRTRAGVTGSAGCTVIGAFLTGSIEPAGIQADVEQR